MNPRRLQHQAHFCFTTVLAILANLFVLTGVQAGVNKMLLFLK